MAATALYRPLRSELRQLRFPEHVHRLLVLGLLARPPPDDDTAGAARHLPRALLFVRRLSPGRLSGHAEPHAQLRRPLGLQQPGRRQVRRPLELRPRHRERRRAGRLGAGEGGAAVSQRDPHRHGCRSGLSGAQPPGARSEQRRAAPGVCVPAVRERVDGAARGLRRLLRRLHRRAHQRPDGEPWPL